MLNILEFAAVLTDSLGPNAVYRVKDDSLATYNSSADKKTISPEAKG